MAGYTRNDTAGNIADGNVISAAPLDGEFDAIQDAFALSTGHTHDGSTTGDGGPVSKLGPSQQTTQTSSALQTTTNVEIATDKKLQFRDTGIFIQSSSDGKLDIDADTEIEIVSPTVDIDASTAVTIDTTTLTITGAANITGDLDVDNININGNAITSTDSNGNIALTPDGTGDVQLDADTVRVGDNNANVTVTTNGTGDLILNTNAGTNSGSITIADGSNGAISIAANGTGKVDIDTDTVEVLSTNAGASAGPVMILQRDSSSPADNDYAGSIVFKHDSDGDTTREIASITTQMKDVSDGEEDSDVVISNFVAGSAVAQITLTTTGTVTRAVLPAADNTHDLGSSGAEWKDLYVDGVAYVDSIAMPTTTVTDILDEDDMSSDSAAALATQQSIKAYVDANSGTFVLEDDDGTEVTITKDKEIKFIGSGITTNWTDTSTGSDGDPYDLTFTVDAAQTGITSILATDLKIGEDDQTKIDFETADEIHFYAANVEQVYLGDNIFGPQSDSDVDLGSTSVRWKDAYVDSVTVTGAFTAGATSTITTSDNSQNLILVSTDADANVGPELHLRRNSSSPANSDYTGEISFNANNDADEDTNIASIDSRIHNVADGSEEGGLDLRTMKAGTMRSRINMYGSTTDINTEDQDIDFKVHTTAGSSFFVQGSDGYIGIGNAAPEHDLDVTGNNSGPYLMRIFNDGNNVNRKGLKIQVGADSGDQTFIALEDGDASSVGSITGSSGTVTYGTFTAIHPATLPSSDTAAGYPYGTLVETVGIAYSKNSAGEDTQRGIIYNVQKSSSANSKAVLGAYSSVDHVNDGQHNIAVLGDGHILCNNAGGNIAVGDGICTSATAGIGQKATASPSMIIGIAQEAVTFANGSETKLVAVQYGLQQFTPWS